MSAPVQTGDRSSGDVVTLFLCGDVMTGRGIDQILPHPGDPTLHEFSVRDATVYVELAERHSGPIPRGSDWNDIWGDALEELDRVAPDVRIVNLETAVTVSDAYWEGKEVHYRMNPANVPCLTAAALDGCVLANNHVLDWGHAGLEETLHTLESARIATAGAGGNRDEAQRPAVFRLPGRPRVLLFAVGSQSSGIPWRWAAKEHRPGVHLVDEAAPGEAARLQQLVNEFRQPDDLVILSIHWGSNWGYEISTVQRDFAHALIDAGVDVVYGHSSHHVKGIEVYRNRPILYGCGDFLTDYEGIQGFETFRGDLGLMYFVRVDAVTHELVNLEMVPTQMRRFQVKRASPRDAQWLADLLNREGQRRHTHVAQGDDGTLILGWV